MLERFFTWWLAELAALLPPGLRSSLQGRRLGVDFDGTTATFRLADGREAAFHLQATRAEVRQACGDAARDVVVRLAAAQALRRTVAMPLAAEANLRAVLGFEMDRYTPFKADDVYYDCTVLSREPEKRSIQVALVLVPRKDIDPLMRSLRGWGLEPAALELQGAPATLNLLPVAQRTRGPQWQTRALAAIATVLALAALAVPLVQKMQALERLEGEVATVRKEALAAAEARKALEQLAAEEEALVNRRRARPAAIDVLQELTRVLPDSAWLNQLELAGNRVRLRGEAANASELLTAIENSGLLKGAALEGAVTRDAKSERERFAISASLAVAAEKR